MKNIFHFLMWIFNFQFHCTRDSTQKSKGTTSTSIYPEVRVEEVKDDDIRKELIKNNDKETSNEEELYKIEVKFLSPPPINQNPSDLIFPCVDPEYKKKRTEGLAFCLKACKEQSFNTSLLNHKNKYDFYHKAHYVTIDKIKCKMSIFFWFLITNSITFLFGNYLINDIFSDYKVFSPFGTIICAITPIFIGALSKLSYYLNRSVFIIHTEENYVLPDIIVKEKKEEYLKTNVQHDLNYYLYRLKESFGSGVNISLSIIQICYTLLRLSVLFSLVDFPEAVGITSQKEEPLFFQIFCLLNIVLEIVLIICNICFWYILIDFFADIKHPLYRTLVINKNHQYIDNFANLLISSR